MKKLTQKAGTCIFCGGTRLTKQHVIPDWMSVHLTPSPYNQSLSNLSISSDLAEKISVIHPPEILIKNHNASFGQFKIRNVCLSCNGGWISRLEQASVDIFTKVLKGDDFIFEKRDAKKLAMAIVVITMMNEFTDPNKERRAIPAFHRKYLMDRLAVPPNWTIGIALMSENGESMSRNHHIVRPSTSVGASSSPSFHVNTMRLGRLLFQAVITQDISYPVAFTHPKFKQLWPYGESEHPWQDGLDALEADDFIAIADSIFHGVLMSMPVGPN